MRKTLTMNSQQEPRVVDTSPFDSENEATDEEDVPYDSLVHATHSLQPHQHRPEIYEALDSNSGNRTISNNFALGVLKDLTIEADKEVELTFRRGRQEAHDSSALSIKVGIHYIPGVDLIQFNHLENAVLNDDYEVHKSAGWKVLTAGDMLNEKDVQRDLRIRHIDQTPEVIKAHKTRKRDSRKSSISEDNRDDEGNKELVRASTNDLVNIASKNVHLLHAQSERKTYDLEATCIEVDGQSLLNLIYNFRKLISQQGQYTTVSAPRTLDILETMIEDARRLLIRSPILTRTTMRLVIQKSKNIRYGVDTGTMFQTFTTSRGIAEVIQQGVAYYSSLNDFDEERAKVRPQFLQMVVILLSLLNDSDLERLRPSLEISYDIKADRESIELTILKVLPFTAVSAHVFLSGVQNAIRRQKIDLEDDERVRKRAWADIITHIAKSGWLLPGPGPQVGQEPGSWMVEWNKKFGNSSIFDYLQYQGQKNTVNLIPSLKIASEAQAIQEAVAELSNGQRYSLTINDLNHITDSIPNQYLATQESNENHCQIYVKQEELFSSLGTIWIGLKDVCNIINEYTNPPSNIATKDNVVKRFLNQGKTKPVKESRANFQVRPPFGTRTRHTTSIVSGPKNTEDRIAICWKLDGRRITHKALLNGVAIDIAGFRACLSKLKDFKTKHEQNANTTGSNQWKVPLRQLREKLQEIKELLQDAEKERISMHEELRRMAVPDEPINKVYFTSNIHQKQDMPFCYYSQRMRGTPMRLSFISEQYYVTGKPVRRSNLINVSLGGELRIVVAPMAELGTNTLPDDDDDFEELQEGEMVLLLGGIAAVVDPTSWQVVTFLHLMEVIRGGTTSKLRRRQPVSSKPKLYETVIV